MKWLLKISNIKMNAREWLEDKYPDKEKRAEQQSLILIGNEIRKAWSGNIESGYEMINLEDELDLNDFTSLEKLIINGQLISGLKINKCLRLNHLVINANDLLSEIDISKNLELIHLDFNDNLKLISPVGQLSEISEKRKNEIKRLKEELNKSKEEALNYRIGIEEESLENFLKDLEIDRLQIRKLKIAYRQLIDGQNVANDEGVEVIKDKLLEKEISVEEVREICSKCETLAKLRIDLEGLYKERYEARQETLDK